VRLGFLPEQATGPGPEPVIGMPGLFVTRLDEDIFFPAAGQGAIGLEIRADDARSRILAEAIGHADTWKRISAEREFLRLLDGGCHTPVGVYSTLSEDQIHLRARVFPESEGPPRTGEASGTDPIATALTLFQSLS
jgi:hydroxymethylbilane synthase